MPPRNLDCDTNTTEDPGTRIPAVTVIVLNWNGRDDTLACVQSLSAVDYPNLSVIIVDNGSKDGSAEAIRERFPHLEIVETGRNLGFAEGNNVGIRLALGRNADYVFLLNNDTIIHPSVLTALVAAAERCPEGGIFTPKIFYHAEPTRIWFAGVRWVEERMEFRHLEVDEANRVDERGVAVTDYACGCALLVKSAALRVIGLLEPKFFLTFEETDLCYRARRVGIECYYVPAAVLWHKISASFGGAESPLVRYFRTRNRLLWGERHLQFRKLMQLYKLMWWELNERFIPKWAATDSSRTLINRLCVFAAGVATRWKDPDNQAVAWGMLHYLFRRFGDAPESVRQLPRAKPREDQSI